MTIQTPFYISRLLHEFECKKRNNSRYSLRAYAKWLDVNPGTLTRILQSERIPSLFLGKQFVAVMGLELSEGELFLNSLAEEKWKSAPLRVSQELKDFGRPSTENDQARIETFKIELDQYHVLSDWIHYAVMELTYIDTFKFDYKWMGKKIGRSAKDVEQAVERLVSLKLLEKVDGSIKKTHNRVTTKDKSKTSVPLKKLQKELLQIAIDSIDDVSFDKRASVSMTMAINPKNITQAKRLFTDFSESICDLLEEGEQTDIYNLIINLSPVNLNNSKGKKNENHIN